VRPPDAEWNAARIGSSVPGQHLGARVGDLRARRRILRAHTAVLPGSRCRPRRRIPPRRGARADRARRCGHHRLRRAACRDASGCTPRSRACPATYGLERHAIDHAQARPRRSTATLPRTH
jgi:hypothetical protein